MTLPFINSKLEGPMCMPKSAWACFVPEPEKAKAKSKPKKNGKKAKIKK